MSEFDDIPEVQPIPADTEPAQEEPAGLQLPTGRIIGVRRRANKSIGECIADLLYRSSNPPLAQTFILDAIEKYSYAASQLDVDDFNSSEMGRLIGGEKWKAMGTEISGKVREYIDFVNSGGLGPGQSAAQLEEEINDMEQHADAQQAVDNWIEFLLTRDWANEFTAEELERKASVDPTGEITARFTPGQTH